MTRVQSVDGHGRSIFQDVSYFISVHTLKRLITCDIPKLHSLGVIFVAWYFIWQLFVISTIISSQAMINFQFFLHCSLLPNTRDVVNHCQRTGHLNVSKCWMHFWFADGIYAHALTTQLSSQLGRAVCDDANVS